MQQQQQSILGKDFKGTTPSTTDSNKLGGNRESSSSSSDSWPSSDSGDGILPLLVFKSTEGDGKGKEKETEGELVKSPQGGEKDDSGANSWKSSSSEGDYTFDGWENSKILSTQRKNVLSYS
jgi:hypothetical protein